MIFITYVRHLQLPTYSSPYIFHSLLYLTSDLTSTASEVSEKIIKVSYFEELETSFLLGQTYHPPDILAKGYDSCCKVY